jgi:hypothetical protein
VVDFPGLIRPTNTGNVFTGKLEISDPALRDEAVSRSEPYIRSMPGPEEYLASFPNSINNMVADLWLFKAPSLGLPLNAIVAAAGLLAAAAAVSFGNLVRSGRQGGGLQPESDNNPPLKTQT